MSFYVLFLFRLTTFTCERAQDSRLRMYTFAMTKLEGKTINLISMIQTNYTPIQKKKNIVQKN